MNLDDLDTIEIGPEQQRLTEAQIAALIVKMRLKLRATLTKHGAHLGASGTTVFGLDYQFKVVCKDREKPL